MRGGAWQLLVPFLLLWSALAAGPSCLDREGKAVDFWYILCHPEGTTYTYADANDLHLSTPKDTLEKDSSPLARTLKQAYHSGVAYAMWNDEHPDGKKVPSPWAHAKGVMAFKSSGGFWLTHSLPKFPQTVAKGYAKSWEAAAVKYGQSYLCLSLDAAGLQKAGEAMVVKRPSVYDVNVPDFADEAVPNFRSWAGEKRSEGPATLSQEITTVGGTTFEVFSKSADFGKDLYADFVAPKLRAAMITETWQNGVGDLPSACKSHGAEFNVMNSDALSVDGAEWEDHQDHSKWAVTECGSVFCVGDINRQSGQFTRGGGTICLRDSTIAKQMRKAVTSFQECKDSSGILV